MKKEALFTRPPATPERKDLYERMDKKSLAPLWDVLAKLLPPEPETPCLPALWHYNDIRPLLMEAGDLITAKAAERRVLVLENPGMRGMYQITQTVYAGVQLILPGEVAPTHRHVSGAFRFVLEGTGAHTAVDGERTTMHPGDFILTPSWTFHDHGNESTEPVIWMDGLDLPMVNFFDASFTERFEGAETQPLERKEGDALARYGANLLPLEYEPQSLTAPTFNYPYSRTRETLEELYKNGPADHAHGVKMQYVNPVTGGYPMPTLAAFIQLLPASFEGTAYRSTDATVYCAVEGKGVTQIGDSLFEWGEHDIFVVPSWHAVSHRASEESVLFSFSDRPAQKALGLWREQLVSSR